MKVLVADDDDAVRKSISRVLKGANYEVVQARNGKEALELFDPSQINLLVLDLGLPIRDGWDAFERITAEAPVLPILLITAQANQYDKAVAAGVGALMEKPLDASQFLQTIGELLAESDETRLRRLCGYDQSAGHIPPVAATVIRKLCERHPGSRRRLSAHVQHR